jgi:hypothetical protein
MKNTYTVYKVELDETLSNKEHLDNIEEVNEWLGKVYGRFATVKIFNDQTGAFRLMTDNGDWWERVS